MVNFSKDHNSLLCFLDHEILKIEPWGRDGVRVHATRLNAIKSDWISTLLNQGEYPAELVNLIHANRY